MFTQENRFFYARKQFHPDIILEAAVIYVAFFVVVVHITCTLIIWI
jgi:hypothetical protein